MDPSGSSPHSNSFSASSTPISHGHGYAPPDSKQDPGAGADGLIPVVPYEGLEVAPDFGQEKVAYYGPSTQSHPHSAQQKEKSTRWACGLRRRTVFVVACLALAGVLGAVLGAVLGSRSRSSDDEEVGGDKDDGSGKVVPTAEGNSTASSTPAPIILNGSMIAATNWTTTGSPDDQWTGIFFQDAGGDIIATMLDPDAGNWTVVPITPGLSSEDDYSKPMNKTPLAAAAKRFDEFDLRLYYLAADNEVMELKTTDTALEKWEVKPMGVTTGKGSRLAAMFQQCDDAPLCSDGENPLVVYQTAVRTVAIARSAGSSEVVGDTTLQPGTGLAITEQGFNYSYMRIYSDAGSTVHEEGWGDQGAEWNWVSSLGEDVRESESLATGSIEPYTQMGATGFGTINWLYVVLVVLGGETGRASVYWWNEEQWAEGKTPVITGGDEDEDYVFDSIAVTGNMKVVGLSGSDMLLFGMDREIPYYWTLEDKAKLEDN